MLAKTACAIPRKEQPCAGHAMLFTAELCPDTAEQCPNTFTSCARPFSCSSPLPHVMRFALAHSMFLQRLVFFNSFWIKWKGLLLKVIRCLQQCNGKTERYVFFEHIDIFLAQYYEISKEMLIELSNESGIWHVQITRTFQFSHDIAANI